MSADNHQQVQDADRVAAAAVPGERTSGTSAAAAADGVASTSIENQRRLRREARQKRILASGANRLNQITATFSGVQPPPAADAAAAPRDAEVPRAAATSAGEQPSDAARGSGAGGMAASVRRTAGERGENEKDSKRAPPGNPRPEPSPSELYAQLAGLRRRFRDHDGDGDENEDEDGFGPDFSFARQNEGFEQMFAQNLRQLGEGVPPVHQPQQWQGPSAKSQETRLRERRNAARWKAAHLLSVLALVLYVVYVEFFTRTGGASAAWRRFALLARQAPDAAFPSERISIVPFFWYLGTMEAMLLSGQLLLQGPLSEGPLPSTIAQFAALNQVFNLVSRYSMIWRTLANDIFTTVFCFGFVVGIAAFCESSGSYQR